MAPGEDDDIMVRRKKNISSCIIICLIAFHYCAPLFLTCPLPLLPGAPASIADLNLFFIIMMTMMMMMMMMMQRRSPHHTRSSGSGPTGIHAQGLCQQGCFSGKGTDTEEIAVWAQ